MVSSRKITSELREATALSLMSLTGAAIAVAAVVGIIVAFSFANAEGERDRRVWEERLGVIAETRASAVSGWLDGQYKALAALAENASLQLYMTELQSRRTGSGNPPAEAEYLQNLLTVIADRAGFDTSLTGPDVNANVSRIARAGIALVDARGRTIAATRGMQPLDRNMRRELMSDDTGKRGFRDIGKGAAGDLIIGLSVPVFAIQADDGRTRAIGRVVGIRQIGADFFEQARQPGFSWETGEIVLVRSSGETVEYLSPRRGGRTPLSGQNALSAENLVGAQAARLRTISGLANDYAGEQSLFAARPVEGSPWTVIVKISRSEAMGSSDSRRQTLIAVFLVLIALVVVGLVAVWRHGTSLRASAAAEKFRDMAHRYEAQSRFLRLVADSQPSPMFIVDKESRFRFANRAAAERADIADSDMIGKSLKSVLGPADAQRYEQTNVDAVETGNVVSRVHRSGSNGDLRVVQADHIPVSDGPDFDTGVLVVEQDITTAVSEREHRESALRHLVRTLLAAVDGRDPYAANHSMQVAIVSRAIAEEMGLDDIMIETAETAGSLMNVGKLLVPSDLLTRAESLGEDDVQQIRESLSDGVALLRDVPFGGPVAETLDQMTEKWNGSGGPRGLSGDDIIVTARIVAVANAFVAMLNPRAWRPGIDFDRAVERILEASGGDFDRAVVAALINRLENKGGRNDWAGFAQQQTVN